MDDRGDYGGLNEIEEVRDDDTLVSRPPEITRPSSAEEAVYVAVGKQTATDALDWTLNSIASTSSSTTVYLVHVFPETKHIPTPLGKLPISQVNPEQKENYMAEERGKRREFLQKFLDICAAYQVRVETILIESDMEAKAILDLIPILNVTKLVLGISKSDLRKMRAKKGNGSVADQILQNAPGCCEVKVICEGKEMSQMPLDSSSPSPSPSPRPTTDVQPGRDTFACGCFNLK